ncbi:MAG: hypothetical protein KJ737_17515 [Proteobacteria bacterium]|nr:hypothetical protein [Pseudomonadota bacterium]
MEMNSINTMKKMFDEWPNMPRLMVEATHRAYDPLFELCGTILSTNKSILDALKKNTGQSSHVFKMPFDMFESVMDYNYFADSFEKAANSLQTALKDEVDYLFEGQKKLRHSLLNLSK